MALKFIVCIWMMNQKDSVKLTAIKSGPLVLSEPMTQIENEKEKELEERDLCCLRWHLCVASIINVKWISSIALITQSSSHY